MAKVTVKLFGVLRVDTGLATSEVSANKLGDIFKFVNEEITEIYEERHRDDP